MVYLDFSQLLALTRRSFIIEVKIILSSLLNETVEADARRDCCLSLSFMSDTSLV